MQAQLAQSSFGRILLHVACACRDHKYQWHWQGIRRERRKSKPVAQEIVTAGDIVRQRISFRGM